MSDRRTIQARTTQKRDTTANWNAVPDFIPLNGEIIVYTDYAIKDGKAIPNIKVGDGLAYLIDLPFVNSELYAEISEHIANESIHTTSAEKSKWNNKLNYSLVGENLILNRD